MDKRGCTAIDYCHGYGCILRGCPIPRPKPTSNGYKDWKNCEGYHVKNRGKKQVGAELGEAQIKVEVVDKVLAEVKLKLQL